MCQDRLGSDVGLRLRQSRIAELAKGGTAVSQDGISSTLRAYVSRPHGPTYGPELYG